MTYYQYGLDWKPKSISKNGSTIPQAQKGIDWDEYFKNKGKELQKSIRAKSDKFGDTPVEKISKIKKAKEENEKKKFFENQSYSTSTLRSQKC